MLGERFQVADNVRWDSICSGVVIVFGRCDGWNFHVIMDPQESLWARGQRDVGFIRKTESRRVRWLIRPGHWCPVCSRIPITRTGINVPRCAASLSDDRGQNRDGDGQYRLKESLSYRTRIRARRRGNETDVKR